MTDLISTPGTATGAQPDDATPTSVLTPEAATDTAPPQTGEQPLAWAPVEPAPKKRRLGLWIGLGLGVVALGKCGAQELNYLCDVDVLFVAEPADPDTSTEVAMQVAARAATVAGAQPSYPHVSAM